MENSKTKNVLTATKNRSPIFKHLCKEDGREEQEEAGFGYSLEDVGLLKMEEPVWIK